MTESLRLIDISCVDETSWSAKNWRQLKKNKQRGTINEMHDKNRINGIGVNRYYAQNRLVQFYLKKKNQSKCVQMIRFVFAWNRFVDPTIDVMACACMRFISSHLRVWCHITSILISIASDDPYTQSRHQTYADVSMYGDGVFSSLAILQHKQNTYSRRDGERERSRHTCEPKKAAFGSSATWKENMDFDTAKLLKNNNNIKQKKKKMKLMYRTHTHTHTHTIYAQCKCVRARVSLLQHYIRIQINSRSILTTVMHASSHRCITMF